MLVLPVHEVLDAILLQPRLKLAPAVTPRPPVDLSQRLTDSWAAGQGRKLALDLSGEMGKWLIYF